MNAPTRGEYPFWLRGMVEPADDGFVLTTRAGRRLVVRDERTLLAPPDGVIQIGFAALVLAVEHGDVRAPGGDPYREPGFISLPRVRALAIGVDAHATRQAIGARIDEQMRAGVIDRVLLRLLMPS